ncbi:MAG: uroporphyrinogen-III C-methyltransferase [Synergistaceae bacterium]|nr:uroporphyrinogen-III C-methyltransferase [Synergistaceae bacterium]
MSRGKVWLVGAGPGDAGLLTLRGREVLEDAEAVVYDRLVGSGVLAFIPEGAEKFDVGKSGGSHPIPQREIEALLVDLAKQGKRVVRLKGGDPFLFGRGGEEMESLRKAGIPFEAVPGVTSALAVPAYAGIPVTHRGLASSLRVITAHSQNGGLPDLNFRELARAVKKETLVFLMGVSNLGELCEELINADMDIATPAAIIERGTTARQRCVTDCVFNLIERVKEEKITPPAILVVGPVAGMAKKFNWRAALPLNGLRVAVTRPRERAGRLTKMLRDAGAEVLSFPCIATEPLPGPLPSLSGFGWLCFTSVTGVEVLFLKLGQEDRDIREMGDAKLAAIGPATAGALRSHGLRVDFTPDVYDGEHLARGLIERAKGPVLLLRAEAGSPGLTEALTDAGVEFHEAALYRTRYLKASLPDDLDMAVFTSASTARAFAECAPEGWEGFSAVKAVCIGAQTAKAAKEAGFVQVITAAKATLEALVEAAVAR